MEHGVRTRHTVSEADIDETLREKGAATLAETIRVTLEPSGKITVCQ